MWNACRDWTQSLWQQMATTLQQASHVGEFVTGQLLHREKRMQLANGKIATIRLATVEDGAAIFAVEDEAYNGNPPWNLEAFVEDLQYNTQAIYTVMSVEQQVIAFVGSRVSEDDIHLTNVAVHSDYRFLGCATLLMHQIENYARQLGKDWLTLEVRQSNTKAIRLYQKFGFMISGYKKQYYKPEKEDAIEMNYALPPKTPSSFNSAEFSFRRLSATQEMAEQLNQLVQANYEYPPHWDAAMFLEDLAQEHTRYYGVYHLEDLVGFVGLQLVLDEATITNIVIRKDFQGKGLAQRLWQMASYDLRQQSIETIFLEVREFNHRAQQLYEILGFEQYHRRRDYYTDPLEDALLYRLSLEKGADK